MMISSAPKVRSASSIACSGSPSPTSPRASTPASRSRARLALEPLLRGRARAVLVRDPVPERRVQRRRDDEHAPRGTPSALLADAPRAASAPPTVSFAITRMRRSSSAPRRAAPPARGGSRPPARAARSTSADRASARRRRATPDPASRARPPRARSRRSSRSSASRKRNASASLRNGFAHRAPQRM